MELRGRVIPEPGTIPPVRTLLEIDASLLDSDVQGLLGTKELAGDEPIQGTQGVDVDVRSTGGPLGAAHLSASCAVVLVEVAAVLES